MSKTENPGRIRNVKRNIFYDLVQFAVSHILPFVVRTILIYRFGADYLGLNSLFTSILSVLSLMDLGFGSAIVYSLYKPAAEDDTDQICAYLTYYRSIYRYVGLAILVAGLTVIPFLKGLVKDPNLPGNMSLYVCYLLFLGNTVISYLLYGYLTVIPTAFQRKDILSRVDIWMSLLGCVVRICILFLSRNFYWYLLTMPALTIIRNLMIAYVVRKLYPDCVCRGEISTEQKQDLQKRVYGILINKLTNVSRNSIDTLYISAFIGLAMTGVYSNYYYVMSSILACGIMICHSMLSSVGNSVALETREKNYQDMRKIDFTFMMIVGWATVCMFCLYQPFILLWVKDSMMLGFPAVIGFCTYYYVLESGAIQWLYHQGAGLWWECRFVMIGEAAANIILNILLCKVLGMYGIILATVLSVFATNVLFCPRILFREYFQNGKLKVYHLEHLEYAATMAVTAGACWWLCNAFLPMSMVKAGIVNGIICLVGRLTVCSLLAVLIFWLLWHRSERFQNARGWLRKAARA